MYFLLPWRYGTGSFGVNLKYGFPLVCGMIGSAVAAVISVGFGVQAFSIGVGGLPGILSIKPEFYVYFLIAMAAAIVIPFVLTYLVGRKKLAAAQAEEPVREQKETRWKNRIQKKRKRYPAVP